MVPFFLGDFSAFLELPLISKAYSFSLLPYTLLIFDSLACVVASLLFAPMHNYVFLPFQACCCVYTCTTVQFLRDVWSRDCSWKGAELLCRNAEGSPARLPGLSASKNRNQECLIWQFPLWFVELYWGCRMKKELRCIHWECLHCWLIFPFYVLYFSKWLKLPDWMTWFWILDWQ